MEPVAFTPLLQPSKHCRHETVPAHLYQPLWAARMAMHRGMQSHAIFYTNFGADPSAPLTCECGHVLATRTHLTFECLLKPWPGSHRSQAERRPVCLVLGGGRFAPNSPSSAPAPPRQSPAWTSVSASLASSPALTRRLWPRQTERLRAEALDGGGVSPPRARYECEF